MALAAQSRWPAPAVGRAAAPGACVCGFELKSVAVVAPFPLYRSCFGAGGQRIFSRSPLLSRPRPRAILRKAALPRATLRRATLSRATLHRATLHRATLSRATLSRAILNSTRHSRCGHCHRREAEKREGRPRRRRLAPPARRRRCHVLSMCSLPSPCRITLPGRVAASAALPPPASAPFDLIPIAALKPRPATLPFPGRRLPAERVAVPVPSAGGAGCLPAAERGAPRVLPAGRVQVEPRAALW